VEGSADNCHVYRRISRHCYTSKTYLDKYTQIRYFPVYCNCFENGRNNYVSFVDFMASPDFIPLLYLFVIIYVLYVLLVKLIFFLL